MEKSKMMKEMEALITAIPENEVSFEMQQKLECQIKEYLRQEHHLKETIQKEREDIAVWFLIKTGKLEVLLGLAEETAGKRGELENTLADMKKKLDMMEKGR